MSSWVAGVGVVLALAGPARADGAAPVPTAGGPASPTAVTTVAPAVVSPTCPALALQLDGGLLLGKPTALAAGLATGLAAGVSVGDHALTWGGRLGWATDTEYTTSYTVQQSDLRLRLTGGLQHTIGRGRIGLRLAGGGTLVHETRTLTQGQRAGLTGDQLSTSAWRMVPAAEFEAVVALELVHPWGLILAGGPSLHILDGLHGGWVGTMGVAWRP